MSKVIKFPTHIRQAAIDEEYSSAQSEHEEYVNDCQEAAQTCLLVLEEVLLNEYSLFDELDFRDEEMPEQRDMFVIMNMISSMLMRYGGTRHFLQDDFDNIYEKLMGAIE
jgi:hypothetical protein